MLSSKKPLGFVLFTRKRPDSMREGTQIPPNNVIKSAARKSMEIDEK